MDKAIVERAAKALAAIGASSRPVAQDSPALASGGGELGRDESLDYEARFGQPHAKLFPFLGRKVRTPEGSGTLLQVFADRVTVLLDSELSKCSFFAPGEIEPVSRESCQWVMDQTD